MLVALDEGPGPPIKYQYAELGKLYTVVSQLVRCCDVSPRMQSSINGLCFPLLCAPLFLNQDLRMRCNVCRLRPVKILILAQDGSD